MLTNIDEGGVQYSNMSRASSAHLGVEWTESLLGRRQGDRGALHTTDLIGPQAQPGRHASQIAMVGALDKSW
jgi:hypothetical protein